MALVKMKRFHMLGMQEEEQKLLKVLQRLGCVEISPADMDEVGRQDAVPSQDLERVKWAIGFLNKYSGRKQSLFATDIFLSPEDVQAILEDKAALLELVAQAEQVEKEQGKLLSEHLKLDAAIEELNPWLDLDLPLDSFHETAETQRLLGYLPTQAVASVQETVEAENLLLYYTVVSEKAGSSYLALLLHKDDVQKGLKLLKDKGFVQVMLKGKTSAKEQIAELHRQREGLAKQGESLQASLVDLAQYLPKFERLYDLMNVEQQRAEQSNKLYQTASSFYVKGWIPENAVEKASKSLQKASSYVELEITEPEEGDTPPVLMHNNKIVTPFESVIKGFSYPSPEGMDPTALMMPFFANFFGMMLSDAGYGLVLAIGLPLLIKFFNPKLSTKQMFILLTWGAGFTVLWGALYNTWFGFAPFPAVFNPVEDPMPVMMICIAMGAIHLFAGLFAAAYMNAKKGDYKAVVFDQLSWAFLLIGLGLLVLPATAGIGKILALVGAGIIILTAGRSNKNLLGRLMGGFGALYGITGWISDLLSYMRLFGMGLATGVIGQVINILVGMVFENGVIGMIIGAVLFVGAHAFNLGINALGAYVHSCRLQYIEFFGKFYEDGGRPFDPLRENTRYIQISKEN